MVSTKFMWTIFDVMEQQFGDKFYVTIKYLVSRLFLENWKLLKLAVRTNCSKLFVYVFSAIILVAWNDFKLSL